MGSFAAVLACAATAADTWPGGDRVVRDLVLDAVSAGDDLPWDRVVRLHFDDDELRRLWDAGHMALQSALVRNLPHLPDWLVEAAVAGGFRTQLFSRTDLAVGALDDLARTCTPRVMADSARAALTSAAVSDDAWVELYCRLFAENDGATHTELAAARPHLVDRVAAAIIAAGDHDRLPVAAAAAAAAPHQVSTATWDLFLAAVEAACDPPAQPPVRLADRAATTIAALVRNVPTTAKVPDDVWSALAGIVSAHDLTGVPFRQSLTEAFVYGPVTTKRSERLVEILDAALATDDPVERARMITEVTNTALAAGEYDTVVWDVAAHPAIDFPTAAEIIGDRALRDPARAAALRGPQLVAELSVLHRRLDVLDRATPEVRAEALGIVASNLDVFSGARPLPRDLLDEVATGGHVARVPVPAVAAAAGQSAVFDAAVAAVCADLFDVDPTGRVTAALWPSLTVPLGELAAVVAAFADDPSAVGEEASITGSGAANRA